MVNGTMKTSEYDVLIYSFHTGIANLYCSQETLFESLSNISLERELYIIKSFIIYNFITLDSISTAKTIM